jgi:hypothetical protein
MSPLPTTSDGLYTVYQGLNTSWITDPTLSKDPRSLIMIAGILPETPLVNLTTASLTADKIATFWTDSKIFGWGRPVLAMNAARLGKPKRAVDYLTAYDFWKFDDAGWADRGSAGTPPPFLDANAAFLYAVAYMAEGWKGSKGNAPGFPKDQGWVVETEGLRKAL